MEPLIFLAMNDILQLAHVLIEACSLGSHHLCIGFLMKKNASILPV